MPTIRDRVTVAQDTATAAARLRELSQDRSTAVREAVAGNPSTPPELLFELARDKSHLVRYAVVHNNNPRAWAAALASPDDGTRAELALRKDLDEQTTAALLEDPSWKVRCELALRTPSPTALARLVRDPDPRVRASAPHNPIITEADVELLANDRSAHVRASAAGSHGISPDTLTRLARDRSAAVRWVVLTANPQRLDLAEIIAGDTDIMNAHQARGQLRSAAQPSDPLDAVQFGAFDGLDARRRVEDE